jgi:hypothetical protein
MTKTETASFSACAHLSFDSITEEGIPIEGYAIHPGIFHEVIEVPETELGNAAKTLQTAIMMLDHSESVRDIVGLVKQADVQYDEDAKKNGVKYQAFVDDKEIALSIQKGKIRDVSIGFGFEPICSECGESFWSCPHFFDEAHVLATNIKVYELSLVPFGADEESSVSIAGFKAQFNDKMKKTDFKKEDKMTKEDKSVDVTAIFEKATEAEKLAFEKEQEAKDLAAKLAAAQKALDEAELAKKEAEGKLSKAEEELKDSKEKLDETSKQLSDKDLEDKKELATEIATLKVEKGLIKEEELEKEVDELMKVDDLEPIKALVEKFEKKEETHETVPKIEEFRKALDEGKIDYKDKKVAQKFIHEIFGYDNVFKGKEPGQTYEGFTKHF